MSRESNSSRSKCAALLLLVAALGAVGCMDSLSLTAPGQCVTGGINFSYGTAPCDSVSISSDALPYVLIGDTVLLQASRVGGGTDGFEWSRSNSTVSFIGVPDASPGLFSGNAVSIRVQGVSPGGAIVSVRRQNSAAQTTINFLSPSDLQGIMIARNDCAGAAASICTPDAFGGAKFRDTATVGDTVVLGSAVKDFGGHEVTVKRATEWSTKNRDVGELAVVTSVFGKKYQAVIAVAPGTTRISASVAGVSGSFDLYVRR